MIAIRLVSQLGGVPATPREAVFGEAGGDIGRAVDCTLVLPDRKNSISRKHLQVAWREGRHFLSLISFNLMVELDGVPLAPGGEYELKPGAQIRVGPFVLSVSDHDAAGLPAPRRPLSAPAAATARPSADDGSGLFGAPKPEGRPSVFHDLLHPADAPARAAAPAGAHPEVDLLLGETGSDLRRAVPLASPAKTLQPDVAGRQPGVDESVLALFAGLGITPPDPAARTVAQMELIGALLRATVGGTLGLLAARGIAKHELGAGQTLVQTRQNNPLKFAADVNAALTRLLEPPQRGFIPALPAVRESFDDLRAHEVAILAGMRAALEAVLARFDPATLEQRWADKGVWENLRPANHKARMWERFVEQHAEIVQEIEQNFDSIFAAAFNAAYEAQLSRLARST